MRTQLLSLRKFRVVSTAVCGIFEISSLNLIASGWGTGPSLRRMVRKEPNPSSSSSLSSSAGAAASAASSTRVKKPGKQHAEGNLVLEMNKPGQRFPTESPGSGDYVFYDTLFKENPNSRMALVWCIEHGVFPHAKAAELLEGYRRAKAELVRINRQGVSASSRTSGSTQKKKKARVTVKKEVTADAGLSVQSYQGIGIAHESNI